MLSNRRYIDELRLRDVVQPNAIPALVSGELVGARPLHLAGARPFGHSKAPLGLLLLRKRESFMQTELSSIPFVLLRPSAGWLQGSPYQRFLLPPAFHFAGAEVLSGSGFGSRSLFRSSRSVPTVSCRSSACSPGCWCRCAIPGNPSCCCTDGNFSKKREGWTVPALLTEPNIKGSEIFSKKLKFRIVFTVQ